MGDRAQDHEESLPSVVWIQFRSGLSEGRSGANVIVVEPSSSAVAARVGYAWLPGPGKLVSQPMIDIG